MISVVTVPYLERIKDVFIKIHFKGSKWALPLIMDFELKREVLVIDHKHDKLVPSRTGP